MNKIIPYTNYLCIQPVERKQVLIADSGTLQTFGKVIAVGEQVEKTKVDDIVAFEMWDLKDIVIDDQKHYFIKEDQAICKLELPGELAS